MVVKITPNDKGNPPGKLADAELHFTEGPLEGLKLIGFAIWERRGGRAATSRFPPRSTPSTASGAASRCCVRSPTPRRRTGARLVLKAYAKFEAAGRRRARAGQRRCRSRARRTASDHEHGSRRAFSCCRFGGSVHSSRRPLSNSAWKNDSFMPPSMMSQGSTASFDRSRKM